MKHSKAIRVAPESVFGLAQSLGTYQAAIKALV